MSLKQKIAIVTGANKGLGFEICRQLLENGFRAILTARNETRGQMAVQQLAANHSDIEYFKMDVTSQPDVDALKDYVISEYQRCDVLVNNAGIFPDPRHDLDNQWPSVLTAAVDSIRQGMETNTYGALRLCQAIIPLMQANQYGRIVNMSSGMGQLSDMNGCCPAYRISKTAINVVTRIFADELKGSDILINSMCPGWVKTDMGGEDATRDVAEGADTAVWLAMLDTGGPSGLFFRDREIIPW